MKPSSTARKDQILSDLVAARREVLNAVEALPSHLQNTPFLGVWSAHDIVAHLIGWDYTNLESVKSLLATELPEFYSHYDPDWRSYNAGLIARYKCATVSESVAAAQASQAALLSFLAAAAPDDFVADRGLRSPRGRRVTVAMLLTAEAHDERKHAQQIALFATGQSIR